MTREKAHGVSCVQKISCFYGTYRNGFGTKSCLIFIYPKHTMNALQDIAPKSISIPPVGADVAPTAPSPRPLDAMEFSSLLNQAPVQSATPSTAVGKTQGSGIGSALPVVEGIQNASNHIKNRIGTIRELTSKANFTGGAADLLKMQLELVQLGFEIELTGKVVTRATQDIDQLSKLQ